MKIVLAVLFVFLTRFSSGDVQCGHDKFCPIGFRPFQPGEPSNDWQTQRDLAKKMAILASKKIIGIQKNYPDALFLISKQAELCRDDTIGFLLDKNVKNYQISCVWTGATQFGQCRAVPPKYMPRAFYYIRGEDWTKKLREVWKAIGCNASFESFYYSEKSMKVSYSNSTTTTTKRPTTTKRTTPSPQVHPHREKFYYNRDSNYELFICNERCVQAGIGYLAMLIMMVALAVSFFQNCVANLN